MALTLRTLAVVCFVAVAAACGGTTVAQSSGSSSGAGGSGSTGSCPMEGCSGHVAASSSTGGAVCGGIGGMACPLDSFCDYGNDHCGGDDSQGVCTPKPGACGKNIQPTCGCDGKVYNNPCEANAAGVDVSASGGCMPPPGTFACGPLFCTSTQYCQDDLSDVEGVPDAFFCVDLPPPCFMGADPSCMCLAMEQCGASCVQDMTTGTMTVTCPGG